MLTNLLKNSVLLCFCLLTDVERISKLVSLAVNSNNNSVNSNNKLRNCLVVNKADCHFVTTAVFKVRTNHILCVISKISKGLFLIYRSDLLTQLN